MQEYRTSLMFVHEGNAVWERSGSNIPHFVMLKKGENIEGILRKASRGPAYGFYDTVVLPEFLQKPSGNQSPGAGQTLGVSELTSGR